MASLNQLKLRVERLERLVHICRRRDAVYSEIARRQQEGRKRVTDWRRQKGEAAPAT